MRAEQWMMLGVGVIGLYAAYRLVKGAPRTQERDSGTNTGALPHYRRQY